MIRYVKVKLEKAKEFYKKYGYPAVVVIKIRGDEKVVYRWLNEKGSVKHYIDGRTERALRKWVESKKSKKRKKKLDRLGKVMSKVSRGEKLSRSDRLVLKGATDAPKKAKSEYPYGYRRKKRRE